MAKIAQCEYKFTFDEDRDTCYYCGIEYHPQLVCISDNKPYQIWVGEFTGLEPKEECKRRALSDGYKHRRDLTPTR